MSEVSEAKKVPSLNLESDVAREVITLSQHALALELRPYTKLGQHCGIGEEEAFAIMQAAHEQGIVRRLGGSFDSAKLGYISTLCALAAPKQRLHEVAALVSAHHGVTHNYERDYSFNLWFTLTARSPEALKNEVASIQREVGCGEVLMLPSTRLFKIRAVFDVRSNESRSAETNPQKRAFQVRKPSEVKAVAIGARERAVIRALQADVSGDMRPFRLVAQRASKFLNERIDEAEALGTAQYLFKEKALRRFGAIVRHRILGFSCNAMGVWNVRDDMVVKAGELMAQSESVSHCYERARSKNWPHNLYTMIHGKDRESCEQAVSCIRDQLKLAGIEVDPPALLVSTHEFKKTSMQYFEEDQ